MRVIAKKTLLDFGLRHPDALEPLKAWHDEACLATWQTPQDIKNRYASASFCADQRVVFNIAGNKYRLVVQVQYAAGIVWVKFVGPHSEYDCIDVTRVKSY